jgi:hypothetical protein
MRELGEIINSGNKETMNMKPWEEKANRLIASACYQSYVKANTMKNGERYKKHVPYIVPQIAENLIACLNKNDEETAKAIFLSYDGMKLTN